LVASPELELNHIYNEDCLEGMKRLPDQSIDLICCDLPFGTTANRWDTIIPLDLLWEQYKRIIKPKCAIVLTAQIPFNITLGASNLPWLRYEWVWCKTMATGFLNAKKMPMKAHENVMVFYKETPLYNPIMRQGKPYHTIRQDNSSTNYRKFDRVTETKSDGERYPISTLTFKHDKPPVGKGHPTQKPVALFQYLIETYTNPGMTVLDNCMGSGTTAIACLNSGRNYIGFELDTGYYKASLDRIAKHVGEPVTSETKDESDEASIDALFEPS
jgi:site-specific DNA-methyltransferase (adenine-specific)